MTKTKRWERFYKRMRLWAGDDCYRRLLLEQTRLATECAEYYIGREHGHRCYSSGIKPAQPAQKADLFSQGARDAYIDDQKLRRIV